MLWHDAASSHNPKEFWLPPGLEVVSLQVHVLAHTVKTVFKNISFSSQNPKKVPTRPLRAIIQVQEPVWFRVNQMTAHGSFQTKKGKAFRKTYFLSNPLILVGPGHGRKGDTPKEKSRRYPQRSQSPEKPRIFSLGRLCTIMPQQAVPKKCTYKTF